MALYVYKTGVNHTVSPNATWNNAAHNVNYDCPTNPLIKDSGSTGATYICAEIRNDDSTVTTMVKQTTGAYNVYNENLEKTAGYRVKCFQNESNTGQRFNTLNLTTHDHFIMLYADDPKQHHFAKITELITDDVTGDALEFTPKLGNEIPKGTKFIVFRGPTVSDTSVMAVGAGLLVDSDTRHHTSLIVSKPLFYFYNDRLDKPNELDHNTKYKLCYINGTGTSSIALNTISVFTTIQDASFKIIDKSPYQLSIKMVDNRKIMDNPLPTANGGGQGDTNIFHDRGSILSGGTSHTDYDTWALNARRDADDASGGSRSGVTQYLHYEDSPNELNRQFELYYSKVFNSIQNRASLAECKFTDSNKIFTAIHANGDSFTVREKIEQLNLRNWYETDLTLDSITTVASNATSVKFKTEGNYDARVLWGQDEEVKIGNYIGFINTIAAASSGLHTVILRPYYRLEAESTFTLQSSSAPFSVGDKIYRRMWSPKTRTLMTSLDLDTTVTYTGLSAVTDHPLNIDTLTYAIRGFELGSYTESRYSNAFIVFSDVNYTRTTVRISYGDKTHKCFRLEPEKTHYRAVADTKTSLDYAFGMANVELEIFEGTIEELTEDMEHGQPIVELVGRDNFSKLVSPIINKNTLFTQDLIHSSMSPLTPKTACRNFADNANITTTSDHEPNVTTLNLSASIAGGVVGDKLFDANNNFIGIVSGGTTGNTPTLEFGSCIRLPNGTQLFKQEKTPYTFKKALSSSVKNSDSVSSLEGASNRGLFFNSGVSLDSSGVKTGNLAGSSKNTSENAMGYDLNRITGIKNDRAFQSLLKDDVGGSFFTSNVVNGLSDFVVVSTKKEDKKTILELAPRVGLYLGRVDDNDYYDADNMTLTNTSMVVSQSISNTPRLTTATAGINTHFKRNDPVFISVVSGSSAGSIYFAGYFIRTEPHSSNAHHIIYLDREITITIANSTSHQIHKLASKDTTDLYFLNKPASLIQKASPFVHATWGLLPFNINIHDAANTTTTTDYIDRYGAPYYRFLDLEEGNYNVFDEYPILNDDGSETKNNNVYYNTPSNTNYYAIAHRFKPSYLSNTPIITNSRTDDFTDLHAKQGIFEKRGNLPSRGSNFFDYFITGNTDSKERYMLNTISSNNRTWEKGLRQMDSKVTRNFLFTTCDLLPESDLRKQSLYYGERDLTDFSILLRTTGSKSTVSQNHTKYLGGGASLTDSDDNTVLAQISSAPSINTLKKFSMLRLVEMTLDWHFNSVDAEHLPDKNRTLAVTRLNKMTNLFKVTDSGGSAVTLDSYGSSNIVVNAAPASLTNSKAYSFYTENGHLIGTAGAQSFSTTITLSDGPHYNENNVKASLTNFYAHESAAAGYKNLGVRGHGTEDTIVNMPVDGEIHMLKGAVFQNDDNGRSDMDGYAEDDDNAFHDEYLDDNVTGTNAITYSMVDLLNTHSRDVDIALPPTFTSNRATKTAVDKNGGGDCYLQETFNIEGDISSGSNSISGISTAHLLDVAIGMRIVNEHFPSNTLITAKGSGLILVSNNATDSESNDDIAIRNAYTDIENVAIITFGVPQLTNNVQYHVWIENEHYIGRTAAGQTYDQEYLIMERSFWKQKLFNLSNAERHLYVSIYHDESLITTHNNSQISEVIRGMGKSANRTLFNETLPVFLDRYNIEDGGQAKVSAGLTASQIIETVPLMTGVFLDSGTTNTPNKLMLRRQAEKGFANFKSTKNKKSKDGAAPFLADGAYMLFKPYLKFRNAASTNMYSSYQNIIATGMGATGSVKKYNFTVNNIGGSSEAELSNAWLNFAPNLTGTYLTSFKGKEYGKTTAEYDAWWSTDSSTEYHSLKGTGEEIPAYIHYVISHTITRTSATTVHEIVIDNASTVGEVYKIMRVAENTFYDFTPKTVKPYCLTPAYTKLAYEDSCYTDIKSYRYRNLKASRLVTEGLGNGSKTYSETGFGEGVSSMYVIADPSNKGSGGHLVYRNPSHCFGTLLTHNDSFEVALFDGTNKLKTNIEVSNVSGFNIHELTFAKMGNMVGATSVGETFTIEAAENIKGDYLTATIGCGVNICFESDELLNDLFEDEGLEFTNQDVTAYPLFISPEYKGVSLMSAANYILERKDRRLVYDKKFLLRDNSSRLNHPNVFINEQDRSYHIKKITKGKKLFNIYNEVIVYGRNVKAKRKNLKSILKLKSKKSLEVVDDSIYTQYDADRKASSLLRLHSKMGELIKLEIKGNKLFTLRAGDVITLQLLSQNIPRRKYLIIEQEHTLDGMIKLTLGEYSRGLEDRFSELMADNIKLKGLTRSKTFKEPSKSNDFFETFKIKEIRIKARLRSSAGSGKIGFGVALNTSSTPIGFVGGSTITYTDLLEDEL
tara:strand:- start:603 stop:7673 length:7071 start_codon:yes stop_codon:yes gene_type:complete